jgi:mannose-6-phosphate isomerase-like protein (cupin superfamily)
MSKNTQASLPPFVQGRRIENSRWYMGNVMTFLVNSEQTDGAFSMTEYLSKPGNEPPAHVHAREDEFLYVLEGRIDTYIGKEVFSAGQNEGVYFPKLIPHTFTILTPQLRMLIWISPGGCEGYFRDMSEPARSLDLPEHLANYGEVDMGHALRAGKERGISFLSAEEIRQQMPPLAKFLARKSAFRST